ncbi:endonuclease VII domain-containing protein [Streptomyces sp. NPDC046759]|uniref:endonuclease VII domain-containing protein n=1 Tax=Streptomyces sp. NPDC046759 TaxID=3155019 RepID=UPI0033F532DA
MGGEFGWRKPRGRGVRGASGICRGRPSPATGRCPTASGLTAGSALLSTAGSARRPRGRYCRECRAERNRVSCFKRKYGLTPAELDALVAEQRRLCCLCLAAPAEHVDHCRKTGRVRGVLCFSCNAALGQFKDQPEAIRRAAAYVEGNAWKPTLVAPGVCRLPS